MADDNVEQRPEENVEKPQRTKEEELFLTSGVHIGTQQKSKDMLPFIFKVRPDGLYVLDVKKSVERIRIAAKMLARYKPEDILFVSARQYGQRPAEMAAKTIGAKYITGRFVPGTLTNPELPHFIEPKIIFMTDPITDAQAMKEAISIGIPIISLCDANNETRYVDFIVPCNNKGRRALATVYWQLTKEYLKETGRIEKDEDFELTLEDFEAKL